MDNFREGSIYSLTKPVQLYGMVIKWINIFYPEMVLLRGLTLIAVYSTFHSIPDILPWLQKYNGKKSSYLQMCLALPISFAQIKLLEKVQKK